jgi:hypothetical protein
MIKIKIILLWSGLIRESIDGIIKGVTWRGPRLADFIWGAYRYFRWFNSAAYYINIIVTLLQLRYVTRDVCDTSRILLLGLLIAAVLYLGYIYFCIGRNYTRWQEMKLHKINMQLCTYQYETTITTIALHRIWNTYVSLAEPVAHWFSVQPELHTCSVRIPFYRFVGQTKSFSAWDFITLRHFIK